MAGGFSFYTHHVAGALAFFFVALRAGGLICGRLPNILFACAHGDDDALRPSVSDFVSALKFAVFALAFQCSCTPLYHHPVPTWLHLLRRVHLCVLHSSSAVSICTSPMCVYMRGCGGSECVLPYCQPRPCACLRGIACCQFYRCVLGGRRRGGDVGVIKQSTLHPEWWFPARKPPRRVRFQHAWETAVKRGALPTRSLSPPANKRANDGGKGILNGGCAVLYCPRGWLLGSTPKAFTQSCRQHEKR